MAAAVAFIPMIVSAVGGIMAASSQRQAGEESNRVAQMNAAAGRRSAAHTAEQLEASGKGDVAASQLAAQEKRREAQMMQSRVLALAAASGGGALDVDVVNAIAGFEEEGDLAARTELYSGLDTQRAKREQAKAGIWGAASGSQALQYKGLSEEMAGKRRATSTILSTAGSLANKYGQYKKAA